MIYTRNKQGFKQKNGKVYNTPTFNTAGTRSTVSENGHNLIQQLRLRMEKRSKTNSQKQTDQISKLNINKGNKISISKNDRKTIIDQYKNSKMNIIDNFIVNKQAAYNQSNAKDQNQNQNQIHKNYNPFTKENKNYSIEQGQKITHQQISNKQTYQIEQNKRLSEGSSFSVQSNSYLRKERNSQNPQRKYIQKQQIQELRKIYQSPIQQLQQSQQQYFFDEDKDKKQQYNISDRNSQPKISKWKNFNNRNSFKIIPLTISYNLCPKEIFKIQNDKQLSNAQSQYFELLQNQIKTLKKQLTSKTSLIVEIQQNLKNKSQKLQITQLTNEDLTQKLKILTNKISHLEEDNFLKQKYDRLFSKMTNTLIIAAMDLIQTKNYLSSSQLNSINSSPEKPRNKKDNQSHNFQFRENILQRIQSINESMAKIEQTIEVSRKVMQFKRNQINEQQSSTQLTLTIKQLEQSILYKDKTIKNLKQELFQHFSNNEKQGPILKGNIKLNINKQSSKQSYPHYSVVEQIHLLRHQINRLTDENCTYYKKILQLNALIYQFKPQQNLSTNKYPNESRVKQIAILIENIGKTNRTNQLSNSKMEYWVNGNSKSKAKSSLKEQQNQNNKSNLIKSQKSQSKSKPHKTDFILFQKSQINNQQSQANNQKSQVNNKKLQPIQQVVIKKHKEKNITENDHQKVEYEEQQFSQLLKQFKSSLSGLTPEKSSKPFKNTDRQSQQFQIIQIPTFRTPKQNQSPQFVQIDHHNNKIHKINCADTIQSNSPQQQQTNFFSTNHENPSQTIIRLEYEKQFLASQRQNLIKQNDRLIQLIQQLNKQKSTNKSNPLNEDKIAMLKQEKINIFKQEIYKLKYQNQELLSRLVQAQNLFLQEKQHQLNQILPFQDKSEQQSMAAIINSQTQLLQTKQIEIQKLMKENIQLHKVIQNHQFKLKQQTQLKQQAEFKQQTQSKQQRKTFNSTNSPSVQQSHFSYALTSNFDELLDFLRKLPHNQKHYYKILLNLIEGYQKKISQDRQENTLIKIRLKQMEQFLSNTVKLLQKIQKNITSLNFNTSNINSAQQNIFKILPQLRKFLQLYQQLCPPSCSSSISPYVPGSQSNSSSRSSIISSLISKINYHLMLLKSLIQGIGQSDLQLVEQELGDYLKQLRNRIPTVLERQEYEENQSSLNTSMSRDENFEEQFASSYH